MRKLLIASLAVVALALGGCSATTGPKQGVGTLVGAGLGAWAGSAVGGGSGRLVAVAVGTLLGAAIGNEIGHGLDELDRMRAQQAMNTAHTAPLGSTIEWRNPDSGNHGSFTPRRDGYDRATGGYCREYTTTIVVGGRQQQGVGTACRQPDGSWRIAN
jgi:surface antigen